METGFPKRFSKFVGDGKGGFAMATLTLGVRRAPALRRRRAIDNPVAVMTHDDPGHAGVERGAEALAQVGRGR